MRTTRIYQKQHLSSGARLVLDADTSHYVGTVLRLRPNAELLVFNPDDGEFAAQIVAVEKRAITVELGTLLRAAQPMLLSIHLGLGISRGDRMDFAIQKSTELGVARITPLYSQFGEVKLQGDRAENKLRHWRKIAASAAEQSGRLDIPEIAAPLALDEWQQQLGNITRLMLDPSGSERIGASNAAHDNGIALLIGPEGGFAEQELDWGRKHGFSLVTLGPRILRTETAPVAALAILQNRFGDM